ncbi:TPA: hypothetical protein QEL15_002544 [Stenotrophomonas maltophilia]|nr:hypothetical protein [Stenotrophomonas maltophilia]
MKHTFSNDSDLSAKVVGDDAQSRLELAFIAGCHCGAWPTGCFSIGQSFSEHPFHDWPGIGLVESASNTSFHHWTRLQNVNHLADLQQKLLLDFVSAHASATGQNR